MSAIESLAAPSASDAALAANGLTKRYGRAGAAALSDVTMAIPKGGVTALVGPNAAGKSTLLRCWVGFERPTAGAALVFGADPWRQRDRAAVRLGYVPQSPALYGGLTVSEHADLAAGLRPSFDRARTMERLAQVGIDAGALGRTLSGGERAQVALALALGTRADVLLLDEPLANLDPLARLEFLTAVKDASQREGTTVVLSSHVVSDVEFACERIVVLGVGRVLLQGAIEAVLAQHVIVAGAGSGEAVAAFASPSGERLSLARWPSGTEVADRGRPASLEEVVLGYLTLGRATSRASS